MSVVDKKGWPVVGSKYDYFQDLLLICNLAALGAGSSSVALSGPDLIICGGKTLPHKAKCGLPILQFETMSDNTVKVVKVETENLANSAHASHEDNSVPLNLNHPPGRFAVEEDGEFKGWNLLEGALRASARKHGHILRRTLSTNVADVTTVIFSCFHYEEGCPFTVLLPTPILVRSDDFDTDSFASGASNAEDAEDDDDDEVDTLDSIPVASTSGAQPPRFPHSETSRPYAIHKLFAEFESKKRRREVDEGEGEPEVEEDTAVAEQGERQARKRAKKAKKEKKEERKARKEAKKERKEMKLAWAAARLAAAREEAGEA